MVWPVAFPLEAFLTRAGITALGSTAASEGIKSLQNQGTISPNIAREAFMRTLVGPTTEILNRTTDTPSGKVFAPTGEIIEPNQIPGIAPPTEQPQGLPGLIATEPDKQVEGMSQASPPTKDKGFTTPASEDMSILYKVEDGEPKYTLSRELDPKLLDEMLVMRGGVKGFEESMGRDNAPLPSSTKRQMFIRYNEKIMDKYGFDKTDRDRDTIPPEELKKLQQKYFTKQDAVDYIVSAAYDVIGGQTKQPNKDTIFALDNEGLPVAAVKMGLGDLAGKGRIEGIAIKEAGSLFPEAFDMVIEEAKKVAKENGKKFLVAEDLTSDDAYNAFKKRGFKPVTNKKFDIFEGKLVYRPGGGKKVKQKNLVFELD